MRSTPIRATLFCVTLVAILAAMAIPATAIIGGQPDVDNTYNNVGMILAQVADEVWDLDGSCTLVKNDADGVIVLTAAHCIDWVIAERGDVVGNMRVTFDPLMGFTPSNPLEEYYEVVRAELHPDYVEALNTTPYLGNAKRFGIGPGREDVALLWLDTGPIRGITPADIVSEGALDALDLKKQTLTVVGYGINGFATGSYMSWRNPNLAWMWSGRNHTEVGVVSEHDAFGDRYLKVTESTAFGDSGGPTFYDGTVVAVTVWGGSLRCEGPAYEYRLDTETAQDFIRPLLHGE